MNETKMPFGRVQKLYKNCKEFSYNTYMSDFPINLTWQQKSLAMASILFLYKKEKSFPYF